MGADDRESVVLVEVTAPRLGAPEGSLGAARGVFGDVLGQRARLGARFEDARDGAVLEGAEALGVAQREGEVVARVTLPQQQDLPCLIAA